MSKLCIVCNNDKHIEDALFCQNCGVSLTNYCSNDSCDFNNGEPILLDDEAKFCPACGSMSDFNINGYFDEE